MHEPLSCWKQAAGTLGRRQKMNKPQLTDINHTAFCNAGTSVCTGLAGQPTTEVARARTEDAPFSLAPLTGHTVAATRWHYIRLHQIFTELEFKKVIPRQYSWCFCSLQSKIQK